jgi:hypothetical protein
MASLLIASIRAVPAFHRLTAGASSQCAILDLAHVQTRIAAKVHLIPSQIN